MRQLSNYDFQLAMRLLRFLSQHRGTTLKEREASRKALLLVRKMEKKENSLSYGKD